jgi:hypothetical protein
MSTAPHAFLRVAAACPPVVVGDPEANADHVRAVLGREVEDGVLVMPDADAETAIVVSPVPFVLRTDRSNDGRPRARLTDEDPRRSWIRDAPTVARPVLCADP